MERKERQPKAVQQQPQNKGELDDHTSRRQPRSAVLAHTDSFQEKGDLILAGHMRSDPQTYHLNKYRRQVTTLDDSESSCPHSWTRTRVVRRKERVRYVVLPSKNASETCGEIRPGNVSKSAYIHEV